MEWFDRLKEKLFGGPEQRAGHLHHGPLVRSERFHVRHAQWLASDERLRWLGHFRSLLVQEQLSADTALHLFASEQATGMQLSRPPDAEEGMLRHLMEEFKDRVIEEGYRLHLSDQRIKHDGEHRERYYLKPAMENDEREPLPQRYGNVLIETWGDGEMPQHLKVLITVYSDRLYSRAESGMALINSLLSDRGRETS